MRDIKPTNTDIIFEYHDVTASDTLENYTREKLEPIFRRFNFVIRADVFFKTENTTSDAIGTKCGIRLSAPGPRLFAETSHNSFHEAVAETVNQLTVQLKKRKQIIKKY